MRRSSSVKRPPVSPILEARELSSIDGSSVDDFSTTSSSHHQFSPSRNGLLDVASMMSAQRTARKDSLASNFGLPPLAPPPQRKTSLVRGNMHHLAVPAQSQQMLSHANPAALMLCSGNSPAIISSSASSLNSSTYSTNSGNTEINTSGCDEYSASSTQSAPAATAAVVDSPVRATNSNTNRSSAAAAVAQSSPTRKVAIASTASPYVLSRGNSKSNILQQSSATSSFTANMRRICFLITHDEQKKGGAHGSLQNLDEPLMSSSSISSSISETPQQHNSSSYRPSSASQPALYISGNYSSSASAKTLPVTSKESGRAHQHHHHRHMSKSRVNLAARLRFMRNETKSESSLFERVMSMGRSGASHSVCAVQQTSGKKPVVKEIFTLTGLTLAGDNDGTPATYTKQDSNEAESPKPWECASALDPNADFDWRRVVREIVFAHTIQPSRRLTKAQSEDHGPVGTLSRDSGAVLRNSSREARTDSPASLSRRSTTASMRSIFSTSTNYSSSTTNARAGRALSRQSAILLSSQKTSNNKMHQQDSAAAPVPKHRRQFDFFYSEDNSNILPDNSKRSSVSSSTAYYQPTPPRHFHQPQRHHQANDNVILQRQTSRQSSNSQSAQQSIRAHSDEDGCCLDCYCAGCQACDNDDAFAASSTTATTFSGHYENSNTLCQYCTNAGGATTLQHQNPMQQLSGSGQTVIADQSLPSRRNFLPRQQSTTSDNVKFNNAHRNSTVNGGGAHFQQQRQMLLSSSGIVSVSRTDSVHNTRRSKPSYTRQISVDSVSLQSKLSTDSIERPTVEALRARRTALPSSNLLEHCSPTKLERQGTKKQLSITSNLVADAATSQLSGNHPPQLIEGVRSMPNSALETAMNRGQRKIMDDEHSIASTICSSHRRRSSVVVIPPMQICPGDLLIYPHTSLFRAVPELEPSSYKSTDSLNSLTSMSNNEAENKASRNKWGFLKLFTDKSRGKSDSLSQITEATTLLANKIQAFQDEQLVRYKALHWSELTRQLGETLPKLTTDEQKRREAIWNCFQSELSYFLDYLLVMKHLYLETLKNMQVEGHLMRVEPEKLFGNLAELIYIIGNFCLDFIARLPSAPEDNVDIFMEPDMLEDVYNKLLPGTNVALVDTEHRYCLNYIGALNYLEQLRKSESFCEFERICGQDKRCKRLQLQDLLVTPVQHCCKRPLLLRDIIKYTVKSGKDAAPLERLLDQFEASLRDIDDKMSWLKNYERIQAIQRRLIWPPVTELQDPKLNIPEILRPLLSKQPCERLLLSPRRALLHEGPTLCYEGNKPVDYQLFLFDDMLLLCKKQKALTKKQKPSSSLESSRSDSPAHDEPFRYVVRGQPMPLDRIMVHDLNTEAHNDNRLRLAMVIIEINRFQQLISVNTVYSPSEAAKVMWLSKIRHAMERWKIEHTSSNIALRSNSGGNSNSGYGHFHHVHHNHRHHQLDSQASVTSMNAAGGTPPIMSRTMSLRRSTRNAAANSSSESYAETTTTEESHSNTTNILPPSSLATTSISPLSNQRTFDENDESSLQTHGRRIGSFGANSSTISKPPRRATGGTSTAWPKRRGLVHQQSVASALVPKQFGRDQSPTTVISSFTQITRSSTPPGNSGSTQTAAVERGGLYIEEKLAYDSLATFHPSANKITIEKSNCADHDNDSFVTDLNRSIGI